MKLAEALQQRSDLNRNIAQLKQRLQYNVVVQEGELPAENPEDLLKELDACIVQLEELIKRINLTNCKTIVEGKTLTEWIGEKDCLKIKIDAYRETVSRASNVCGRYSRTEIKQISAVNVRELQKKVDSMSAELRKIDNLIQQSNWITELA